MRKFFCLLICFMMLVPFTLSAAETSFETFVTAQQMENLEPDFTLGEINCINMNQVSAAYYRIDDGTLFVRRVYLKNNSGNVITKKYDCMPVPLSESLLHQLDSTPFSELLSITDDEQIFRNFPDALDRTKIPVSGKILSSDLQRDCLVLITELPDSTRELDVIEFSGGSYVFTIKVPVSEGTGLDTFHFGSGIIYLTDETSTDAEYRRRDDGKWRLSYYRHEHPSCEFNVFYGGANLLLENDPVNSRIYGVVPNLNLEQLDYSRFPVTAGELRSSIVKEGLAVVNNPDPNDRLNLRTEPAANASTLGKFYNGTAARVLGSASDESGNIWCRVEIGSLSGWMMKKYLTFGAEMDNVKSAMPYLYPKSENEYNSAYISAFSDSSMDRTKEISNPFKVIGVYGSKAWIIQSSDGETGYVPADWLWAGNG